MVLVSIATAIGQYAFCVLVTPPAGKDPMDLDLFHRRQHRKYSYADWGRDTIACCILAAFVALTLLGQLWVQLTGTLGFTVFSVGLMTQSAGIIGQ